MNRKEVKSKMKQILLTKNGAENGLGTNSNYPKKERFDYVFDYVYKSLNGEYQNILSKTYISPSFKYWWVEIYSKSSFYRLREKALTSFISLFEMMYENI